MGIITSGSEFLNTRLNNRKETTRPSSNVSVVYMLYNRYIHAYIIWPLQPSSYSLASDTTHFVWVNFVREWRNLQFNVDSERQIFEKLFHGRFIHSQNLCQKYGETKSPKKYFPFIFCFVAWVGIRTHALRLTSQHTIY